MRCFMDKTNDIHLEKLFETKEIIPNSFLTTIEEEMLVLQNKISELEKKNLNLLIQNSASQKFKDEISLRDKSLNSLKEELHKTEKQLSGKEGEILHYKTELIRLQTELDTYTKSIQIEKQNFLQEKKKIEGHAFDFVFDISQKYKDGLTQNEVMLNQIKADLEKANLQINEKEAKLFESQQHIASLKDKINYLNQSYESEKNNFFIEKKKIENQAFEFVNDNYKLEIDVLNLKNQLSDTQSKFDKTKFNLDLKTTELRQTEILLQEQTLKCDNLLNQIEEIKSTHAELLFEKESDISNYKLQVEALNEQIEFAKKQYEDETGYKLKLEQNKSSLALEKTLLQSALSALQLENTSFKDQLTEVNLQLENLQTSTALQLENIQTNTALQIDNIQTAANLKIENIQQIVTQKEEFIFSMQQDMKAFENKVTLKQQEITTLSEELNNLKNEKNKLSVEAAENHKLLLQNIASSEDNLNKIKVQHESEINQYQTKIDHLKSEITEVQRQKEDAKITFESLSEQLKEQLNDQNHVISHLSVEMTELENLIDTQKIELENIKKVKLNLESTVTDLQLEIETKNEQIKKNQISFSSREEELKTKINLITEQLTQSQMQCKKAEETLEQLNSKVYQMECELSNTLSTIKKLEIELVENKEEISKTHQYELEALKQSHLEIQKNEIQEKSKLMLQINNLEQMLQIKTKDFEKQENIANSLTKQTVQYVDFIETERLQIKKVLNQLTVEIKTAVTLHPLKDYRDATELELTKVELELRKMPASSSLRTKVEMRLEQLYIQRNQLNDLINKTEKHILSFEAELIKVENMAQVLEIPVPPSSSIS